MHTAPVTDPSPEIFTHIFTQRDAGLAVAFQMLCERMTRLEEIAEHWLRRRSQMAAAWFNEIVDPTVAKAISAGTQPDAAVHPEVVTVMKEVGIDLSAAQPRKLTDDLAREAKLLVTMGCGEASPNIPGLRTDDWAIENPKGKPVEIVREIRDDVKARVLDLVAQDGLKKKN
ncbi:g466 [Coccomyxa elongata]